MAAQLAQHALLVLRPHHVDEVHDDDAAQIAQARLTRNGLRRLEIRLEDGLVEIARPDKTAGVHVDGSQRLGLVDHHIATGLQIHAPSERTHDFLIDGEQVENRPLTLVVLQLLGRCGHELFAKVAQQLVLLLRIDADALRGFVHHVAQHALQQAQILMQQRRRRLAQRQLADARTGLAQIAHVLFQLGIAGILGVGAHDIAARPVQPRLRRQLCLQLLHALAQHIALRQRNLLRHANAVILRQVHHHATGNADLRGQARTLAAQRILDHLHHQGLAFEHQLLDRFGAGRRLAGGGAHALHAVGLAPALPHIGHMQKGGALQPDIDKGRLHARQHAHHLAQVDIAHTPTLQCAFDMQFLHHAVLDHGGARLLRRPVDQNVLLHESVHQACTSRPVGTEFPAFCRVGRRRLGRQAYILHPKPRSRRAVSNKGSPMMPEKLPSIWAISVAAWPCTP